MNINELKDNKEINPLFQNENLLETSKSLYENMSDEEKDSYERLIKRLPEIQDRINRDSEAYKEEFHKILLLFKEQFEIILKYPNKSIKGFKELLMFFSHISNKFPEELKFIQKDLPKILSENYLIIPHEMRLAIVDSLSLLRKKELLSPMETLPLFFSLIKCQDKILRKKLTDCIISDLKKIKETKKNLDSVKKIQNFCETILNDPNKKLARKTLNILISLYQKKIWNDDRTVNLISKCVSVNDIKMSSAACKFFLSEYKIDEPDTSSEEELDELKNKYKLLGKSNNRKTKQRKAKLKQLMKSIERKEKRHSKVIINKDFMPIDRIKDPLSFSQELFKKANSYQRGEFSHKLIVIRLLGRVLGRQRLLLENYYNFMLNFMKSDQKDIEIILASLIESCHNQIPPSELEPIINKLFDNFISENYPPQLVNLGLNTLREIIERCPYCIDKGQYSIIQDLRYYKNKSVSNAARSIVNLCKEIDGKFGKGNGEISFGDNNFDFGIEGIELLKKLEKKPKDYKMDQEEILDEKQLKKLKALKIKYEAELMQHRKVGISDQDINEMVGEKKKFNEDIENNENNESDNEENESEDLEIEDDDNEELEEIEDEELEEIEDEEENDNEEEEEENEEEEEKKIDNKKNKNKNKNKNKIKEINNKNNKKENKKGKEEEEEEENWDGFELEEISDDKNISLDEEKSEEIELSESEISPSNESSEIDDQGFIDPDNLKNYKLTRREKFDKIRSQKNEKEKYKVNRKEKNGGKTNKEKLKNKPYMMVKNKRLRDIEIKKVKLKSMKKQMKNIKQQLGRFKRGNMILKKKGGLTRKK